MAGVPGFNEKSTHVNGQEAIYSDQFISTIGSTMTLKIRGERSSAGEKNVPKNDTSADESEGSSDSSSSSSSSASSSSSSSSTKSSLSTVVLAKEKALLSTDLTDVIPCVEDVHSSESVPIHPMNNGTTALSEVSRNHKQLEPQENNSRVERPKGAFNTSSNLHMQRHPEQRLHEERNSKCERHPDFSSSQGENQRQIQELQRKIEEMQKREKEQKAKEEDYMRREEQMRQLIQLQQKQQQQQPLRHENQTYVGYQQNKQRQQTRQQQRQQRQQEEHRRRLREDRMATLIQLQKQPHQQQTQTECWRQGSQLRLPSSPPSESDLSQITSLSSISRTQSSLNRPESLPSYLETETSYSRRTPASSYDQLDNIRPSRTIPVYSAPLMLSVNEPSPPLPPPRVAPRAIIDELSSEADLHSEQIFVRHLPATYYEPGTPESKRANQAPVTQYKRSGSMVYLGSVRRSSMRLLDSLDSGIDNTAYTDSHSFSSSPTDLKLQTPVRIIPRLTHSQLPPKPSRLSRLKARLPSLRAVLMGIVILLLVAFGLSIVLTIRMA